MSDLNEIRECLISLAEIDRDAPIRALLQELDRVHANLIGAPNVGEGDVCLVVIHDYLNGLIDRTRCEAEGRRLFVLTSSLIAEGRTYQSHVLHYLRALSRLAISVGAYNISVKDGLSQIMVAVDACLASSSVLLEITRPVLLDRLSQALEDLTDAFISAPVPIVRSRTSLLAD